MATKQMAYDHAAYLVPQVIPFVTSSAAPASFAAFTNMILKNMVVTVGPSVATNNSTWAVTRIYGTNTSTLQSFTIGTGTSLGSYSQTVAFSTNTNQTLSFLLGTATVTQGDLIGVAFTGGDGVKVGCSIEALIVPGANVTV